jgi:hypothetical protein
MKKLFFAIVALLAGFVSAFAAEEKCDKCDLMKHPRERVLKPITCVPIKFVRNPVPGSVVVTIAYRDGRVFSDTKRISTGDGQFCFGPHRFVNVSRIELCDADKSAVFDRNIPSHVAYQEGGRNPYQGITLCLRGSEWCSKHSPKR